MRDRGVFGAPGADDLMVSVQPPRLAIIAAVAWPAIRLAGRIQQLHPRPIAALPPERRRVASLARAELPLRRRTRPGIRRYPVARPMRVICSAVALSPRYDELLTAYRHLNLLSSSAMNMAEGLESAVCSHKRPPTWRTNGDPRAWVTRNRLAANSASTQQWWHGAIAAHHHGVLEAVCQ